MRALMRRWPKRQGRMILQSLYGPKPEAAAERPAPFSVSDVLVAPEVEPAGDVSLPKVELAFDSPHSVHPTASLA